MSKVRFAEWDEDEDAFKFRFEDKSEYFVEIDKTHKVSVFKPCGEVLLVYPNFKF